MSSPASGVGRNKRSARVKSSEVSSPQLGLTAAKVSSAAVSICWGWPERTASASVGTCAAEMARSARVAEEGPASSRSRRLGDRRMEISPELSYPSLPNDACSLFGHRLASGRATVMENVVEPYDALIRSGARRLTGYQRRLFQAEVVTALCGGNARQAERRFGWGRETVEKGLHERHHGVRCLENFVARGRQRSEQKDPQLAADIRAIVEPHTYADPGLKSARRYTNLSAAEVRDALSAKGYPEEALPSERTMRDILNRMNYRLKRIQKGKPLKKTDQTDAIFANVKAVRDQVRDQPETLEISMDTKAKVALGEYVRGGKNPDGLRR